MATGKRLPPAAMLAGIAEWLWTFADLYDTVMGYTWDIQGSKPSGPGDMLGHVRFTTVVDRGQIT